MSELLVKTAEFFLIPEAILSAVFLVIFVGIFAFGLYRQRKCQEFLKVFDLEADENFKAFATKMTPEMFIKKNLHKLSVMEDVLEELPNVFVSIGIIATFLGLGVAIQGAAELLQTDKLELPKLTAVLGVIAFKFQTSVWGICFSIIFRNIIVERYFEFRRQIVDEITDRLYVLERENARTLIERQNELLIAQHKEMLATNSSLNLALIESLTAFEDSIVEQTRKLAEMERENVRMLIENQNELLVTRLNAFENAIHNDNLVANEHLKYMAENYKKFFKTVDDFAKNELTFAESVDAFTQRVKLFQEEFAMLVHQELADLRKVNEDLGRTHAEHIQAIQEMHTSNIAKTTEELDKLHQKFYLDARRFVEESRKSLDDLLEATIGRVHDEYTREAHEIRAVIGELNATLSAIENNVNSANLEFTAEQKQFLDSWHAVTNRVSETMGNLTTASAKENDRLDTMHKLLSDVAHNMQSNSAENFERTSALMKNTADNFQAMIARLTELQEGFSATFKALAEKQNADNAVHLADMSVQSQAMVDAVKVLRENISQLTLDNQSTTETLRDELVAVKDALKNLTAVISAEDEELKKIADRAPSTSRKLLPTPALPEANAKKSNTVDGRYKK